MPDYDYDKDPDGYLDYEIFAVTWNEETRELEYIFIGNEDAIWEGL